MLHTLQVGVFFMLQSMCAISIEGAAFYFFTDNEKQFPTGPNFDPFYYTVVLGTVSQVFSLVGS